MPEVARVEAPSCSASRGEVDGERQHWQLFALVLCVAEVLKQCGKWVWRLARRRRLEHTQRRAIRQPLPARSIRSLNRAPLSPSTPTPSAPPAPEWLQQLSTPAGTYSPLKGAEVPAQAAPDHAARADRDPTARLYAVVRRSREGELVVDSLRVGIRSAESRREELAETTYLYRLDSAAQQQ